MSKEAPSPTVTKETSSTFSLPEELKKRWPIFAAATGAAITVASFGYLLWKLRDGSGEKEQKTIDEIVGNLSAPSEDLKNLGVILLAEQTAQHVRELTWKGETGVLDLFIKACNKLGVQSPGIETLEDDLVAASSATVQENFQNHN